MQAEDIQRISHSARENMRLALNIELTQLSDEMSRIVEELDSAKTIGERAALLKALSAVCARWAAIEGDL